MYHPVKGFAPDSPLDLSLTLREGFTGGWLPTLRGLRAMPSNASAGVSAVASTVASAVSVEMNDGSYRLIVGTEGADSDTGSAVSKLYEVNGKDWNDVSAAGGNYTASANARWTFASYNDTLFAAQKGTKLQQLAAGSASFATVTTAPKAVIVENVLDFVFLFNVDDTERTDTAAASAVGNTYGDDPNRWWCCAAGNPFDWNPNIGTQCTTGLLTDSPGAIVAAKRLGSNIVAYKSSSMYFGQYINAPLVWGWTQVPGDGLGTWSPWSVEHIEGIGHLFAGNDNFYLFDGSRATPIGDNQVVEFFLGNLNFEYASRVVAAHDRKDSLVYWFYPSNAGSGGALDRFLTYNYRSRLWGAGIKDITFPFGYNEPQITYDTLGDYYATWDDLPNIAYDKAFLTTTGERVAIFDSSNILQKFDGEAGTNTFSTNYFGGDDTITLVDRLRPRFQVAPDSGSMVHQITDVLGGVPTTVLPPTGYDRGAFDTVYAGRWHRFDLTFTGDVEILGLDVRSREDSLE